MKTQTASSLIDIYTTTLPADTAVYVVVYSFYFSCPVNGGWDNTKDYFTSYTEARQFTSKLRADVGHEAVRGYKSTVGEENAPLDW